MHVGYGAAFQQIDDEPDELFLRSELELCLLAESLGMDSIWLPEHRFSSYGLMPAATSTGSCQGRTSSSSSLTTSRRSA